MMKETEDSRKTTNIRSVKPKIYEYSQKRIKYGQATKSNKALQTGRIQKTNKETKEFNHTEFG